MIKISKYFTLCNLETASFESFIPLITIVGSLVLFYYGYKGIVKKKTISLFKQRGFSARESHELFGSHFTGISAVIFGIIYILFGLLLLFVALSTSSWSTIFGV